MQRCPFRNGLSQQTAQKRTVHLHHVWKIQIKHVADRLLHYRVISTDVENAVAAQKIQIRLVIHIVEIRALGSRIDFVETDDALRCHERAVNVPLVQFVVLAKTRGDNLLQIESHEEQNFSDSYSKRKYCSRFAACHAEAAKAGAKRCVAHRATATKRSCRIQSESCSSILRIQLRLIFDYHTLNRAMLDWSGLINTNLLARSQRSRHRLASGVNNVRGRAESETYRALFAPDDNRLAGLICTHRARLVSCTRGCFCCGRWSVRCCCFFGRGSAGLCKRQRRN